MTNTKCAIVKCVGCGAVKEMDAGFASSIAPSPEISTELFALDQARSMSLAVDNPEECEPAVEKPATTQHVHSFGIDECPECHGTQWYRIGDETSVFERPRPRK